MALSRKRIILAFLSSSVITLLGFVLLILVKTQEIKNEQMQFAHQLTAIIDVMFYETTNSLASLNKNNIANSEQNALSSASFECNENKLLDMRKKVFVSRYIKEIGHYYAGKLVCDTSKGLYETPFDMGTPDFVTIRNNQVWLDPQFPQIAPNLNIYAIKQKRYHVVLDPQEIFAFDNALYRWEWIYQDDNQHVFLYGERGLYRAITNENSSVNFPMVTYIECTAHTAYCFAIIENFWRLVSGFELTAAVLILILLMSLSFVFWLRWINYLFSTERRVKIGLKRKRFYPLFSPIVDVHTFRVVGCEVLARMQDGQGTLRPKTFLPLIQKARLTKELTRAMLKSAHKALLNQTNLPEGFRLSFNVFSTDGTEEAYQKLANSAELFKSRFTICFELSEDEPFQSNLTLEVMNKIKSLGIEIAIDDFGTGYANILQLRQLNFDYIKIDKSFIRGIEMQSIRSSFVQKIVEIAQQLDIPVVAEGVDNKVQFEIIKSMGVQYAQGFYFSRPLNGQELDNYVAKQDSVFD
ncbi:EAL domain-containing protein [Glaciecola sp. 1036]|uniref:EAL domain-containing protein n=1 Tax=Alteromonadaceae TaxID=72275 RepID=UPI003D048965